ncbi:MAG: GtrA family protein [Candidatus Diapherotrites archaeon]|jgi:putative flippase GtrA|nr:GtrA family protein [Candidatus Diapherotrites archaeon]MBT4597314.1 GtrA family protein [Candidatus Diapherotrites archaeon]
MNCIMKIQKLLEKKFFRYCFCGGIAAIVDLGLFFILNELFLVHYLIALTISFPIAIIVNYALQRRVTFKSKGQKRVQVPIFFAIQIGGWALNAALTALQVEIFGVWPTFARLVAGILVIVYTYSSNKKITFKERNK